MIGGTPAGPSSTSWGISTHTGPYGAVDADVQASRSAVGIWLARRTTCTDFTTSRKLACWSGSSCRYPWRPPPSPATGIWLEIPSTGTDAARDSCREANVSSAPGPVETTSGRHRDRAVRVRREPGAGVPVGGEGEVVLDAPADHAQVAGAPQRLEQAQRVLARQAEHRVGAQGAEGLDNNVAADAFGVGHALFPKVSRLTRS